MLRAPQCVRGRAPGAPPVLPSHHAFSLTPCLSLRRISSSSRSGLHSPGQHGHTSLVHRANRMGTRLHVATPEAPVSFLSSGGWVRVGVWWCSPMPACAEEEEPLQWRGPRLPLLLGGSKISLRSSLKPTACPHTYAGTALHPATPAEAEDSSFTWGACAC